jgi:hypothetical protein
MVTKIKLAQKPNQTMKHFIKKLKKQKQLKMARPIGIKCG